MRTETIAIVESVTDVELTGKPFGRRWGQERLTLKSEHLETLTVGDTKVISDLFHAVITTETAGEGKRNDLTRRV